MTVRDASKQVTPGYNDGFSSGGRIHEQTDLLGMLKTLLL